MTLPVAMFYYLQRQQDPVIAALSTFLIVIALAVAAGLLASMKPQDLARLLCSRSR
jgi:ABC-type spermidine/putrescine transport system permease subunit II